MHLEQMVEKAQEWIGKVEWMSKVNGLMQVERGRLVWELLGTPAVEHAGVVQERIGRRLLGCIVLDWQGLQ